MPRLSEKQKCLQIILSNAIASSICTEDDTKADEELMDCILEFQIIQSFRYTGPRDHIIPKSTEWYREILPNYDDNRFKCNLRVTREEFSFLLSLISQNPIFKSEGEKMVSVQKQLAVALFRFGTNGSAASFYKIGQTFGMSDGGTIRNCTDRIIQAFLEMERQYIQWPSVEERKIIEVDMIDKLPKCIGYLDGSHVNLFEAPIHNHESYFSRKQKYGIQIQAICDNDCVIRSLTVGFPASVHDSRVFLNSPLGQHPEKYLSDGQWIAADSAYKLTEFVLTPFRDNSSHGTKTQRGKFNSHFSGYRVRIEQTFGILKNVFQSLQNLRIRVDQGNGHKRACQWIVACCIIYNIIRPRVENIELEEQEEDDLSNEISTSTGEAKRDLLFNWINKI